MTSGICGWGGCTNWETPIVVTLPDLDSKTCARFCSVRHLAAWAIKVEAKRLGVHVSSSRQESLINGIVEDALALLKTGGE